MTKSNAYIHAKEDRSAPDLSSIPPRLTDDDIIGFGKHRYTRLGDVPVEFFIYMTQEMILYPRVDRSKRWCQVIDWLKSKSKD